MNTSKNYWLLKSEPSSWSWDQQKKKKTEHWDGVRNYQAANNMKKMIDVTYVKDLNEVYLSEIKADPFFQDFPLVKQARLSVMPVTLKQWKKLIKMSEKNERI